MSQFARLERDLTIETLVISQASHVRIEVKKNGTDTGFFPSTLVERFYYYFITAVYSHFMDLPPAVHWLPVLDIL